MNRNKTSCIICHGFNKFFDVPKFEEKRLAAFRVAIVIKKRDFSDEWDAYDALFWRIIQRIASNTNAMIHIRSPELQTREMQSLEELRTWQKQQSIENPEFEVDAPTEIQFVKGDDILCHMTLEDWSDIGKIEPYSCSYTFSFYCFEENVASLIDDSIMTQLSQDEDVAEVKSIKESASPKWFWPLINMIKREEFLIYVGLGILALFAIVMMLIN